MAQTPSSINHASPAQISVREASKPVTDHCADTVIVGQREIHNCVEAAEERIVKQLRMIRRGDHNTLGLVFLQELQERVFIDVLIRSAECRPSVPSDAAPSVQTTPVGMPDSSSTPTCAI